MVKISPGNHVGVDDGMTAVVGEIDAVTVGVKLPPRGKPPTGRGVPAGLALTGGLGSATPARSPLAAKLLGAVALKLA